MVKLDKKIAKTLHNIVVFLSTITVHIFRSIAAFYNHFLKKLINSFTKRFAKVSKYLLVTVGTFLTTNRHTRPYFDRHGWTADGYRKLIKFIDKQPQRFTATTFGFVAIVFIITQVLMPVSAAAAWNQSDWSGGVGGSTTNQYSSASNISTSGSGFSLSPNANKFTNGDFESSTSGDRSIEATGGTITDYVADGTNGTAGQTYRVHSFTTTGTSAFNVTYAPAGAQVDYLVVGGGGGGGYGQYRGGGGGAGGYYTNMGGSGQSISAQAYAVVVGSGGSGGNGSVAGSSGGNGSASSIFGFSANGGGGGGGGTASLIPPNSGGSGGGGAGSNGALSGRTSGGAGTAGQGNTGGQGGMTGATGRGAGGGGGAGSVGSNSAESANGPGGAGGTGLSNSISGSSLFYAGGGGGGGGVAASSGGTAVGGSGVGGNGTGSSGTNGMDGRGGGGGGAGFGAISGNGGSGVVIVRYPINSITSRPVSPPIYATGGTTSTYTGNGTNGALGQIYKIHAFKSVGSSSLVVNYAPAGSSIDYLVVAGGGGGGGGDVGAGGGAGGLIYVSNYSITVGNSFSVTVGDGGNGSSVPTTDGSNGSNSVFGPSTAIGGGGAASYNSSPAQNGGSGGGGAGANGAGGSGTAGQGNNGGTGTGPGGTGSYPQGGGGGAGAFGGSGNVSTGVAGNGGDGLYYAQFASIGGSPAGWFAGGGGGATETGGTPGYGGNGGGGNGGRQLPAVLAPTAGATNTGGGGGGADPGTGGKGGSGIVAVRYTYNDSAATINRSTSTTYNSSSGSLYASPISDYIVFQNINAGATTSFNLEAYIRTDGSAVTSSDAQLYVGSSAIATTYTSVGGGWYKMSAVVTGTASSQAYGVLAKAGKSIYLDNLSLYDYPTSGTLTSNIYDLGYGGDWGTLTYTSTGTGTVSVKVRSGNNSDMSDASAWSSCPNVSSGTDLTGLTCMNNNDRYLQYQVTLNPGNNGVTTPTFTGITINYDPWDTVAPTVNASGIVMSKINGGSGISAGGWTNGSNPSFTWTSATDNVGGTGIKGYCLYLGQDNSADLSTTKGLLGTSPISTGGKCAYAVSGTTLDTAVNALSSQFASSSQSYYLLIKAIDNGNNLFAGSAASFNFKFDNTAPQNPDYVSAPSQLLSSKNVTITWPTSGATAASDSHSGIAGLQYRIGNSGTWYGVAHNGAQDLTDILSNDGSYQTRSAFDYDQMDANANNIFQFRTIDNAGNTSAAVLSTVVKINTTAPSSPRSLTATPTTNTSNSFAFSWAAPTTYAGSASDISYCYTVNTAPTANTCTFTDAGITSLSASAFATQPGDNTFYVVAKDQAGNINYATAASVTFTANTSAPGIPLNTDVADISVKATRNWKLAISWEKPSDEGAGVATYRVYRSTSENSGYTQVATTSGTSYVDSGLSAVTYYYKVKACDSANNCGAFSSVASKLPTGRYTTPADLIGTPSVSVSTRKATITWTTDRTSDSRIQYGTGSGKYQATESSIGDQVKVHQVELTGLEAGTTYYYKAKWTDEDGNTGSSSELSFTTLPAPTISDVKVLRTTLTSALIQFTSKDATKVNMYYGKTKGFGGLKIVNTSLSESTYTIEIDGLDDGSPYFFRIDGVDVESYTYSGTIFSFTTPQRPRISNLRFQPIAGEPTSTQKVSWTTNVPASSTVTYGLIGSNGADIQDSKLVTEHEVVIRNLLDDSNYFLSAQSRDIDGNLAVSDRQTFKTALDTRPPKISNMTVETTIRGTGAEARGQIIVSWETDEPATSQVAYGEGSDLKTLNSKTAEDAALATQHVVIISDLPTSRVYTVQPVSADKAANSSSGESKSAIIGRATDSVITIVLNTLRKVFGF